MPTLFEIKFNANGEAVKIENSEVKTKLELGKDYGMGGNQYAADLNGDGKTDSGSVKREVMQIINSLPISSYQKDVLYFINGWSQSTLWEAPWH